MKDSSGFPRRRFTPLATNESPWVNQGITEKQIEQLINFANTDPEVKKFTSDSNRFRDREAFDKWRKKDRVVYTLTDKSGDLLGILWFGKKSLPIGFSEKFDPKDYTITFAIRTYGDARGKGLAKPFMRQVFNHFSPKQGVWLETSIDNKPALVVYERFGFKQVTDPDEEGKILMVLPPGPFS